MQPLERVSYQLLGDLRHSWSSDMLQDLWSYRLPQLQVKLVENPGEMWFISVSAAGAVYGAMGSVVCSVGLSCTYICLEGWAT